MHMHILKSGISHCHRRLYNAKNKYIQNGKRGWVCAHHNFHNAPREFIRGNEWSFVQTKMAFATTFFSVTCILHLVIVTSRILSSQVLGWVVRRNSGPERMSCQLLERLKSHPSVSGAWLSRETQFWSRRNDMPASGTSQIASFSSQVLDWISSQDMLSIGIYSCIAIDRFVMQRYIDVCHTFFL